MEWLSTHEDEEFEQLQTSGMDLASSMFYGCTFSSCTFTEASFRSSQLAECRFENCDLALVDLTDTLLHTVLFDTCRLRGVNFGALKDDAVGITAEFKDCDLSFTTFRGLDLRACAFRSCRAHEAEFVRCNLVGVAFENTDLAAATFQDNDMTNADLRGAKNYVISAHRNRLRGARVELPEALGLLAGLEVRLHS